MYIGSKLFISSGINSLLRRAMKHCSQPLLPSFCSPSGWKQGQLVSVETSLGWQWMETARPEHTFQMDSSSNTNQEIVSCNTASFQLKTNKDTNRMDVGCNHDYKNYSRHDDHVKVDETQHGPHRMRLDFPNPQASSQKSFHQKY